MLMMHDGVDIFCLPEGAYCKLDEEKRSPLDIDECPIGMLECNGDCINYDEDYHLLGKKMSKRNCKICSEYRTEEIGDSDFGAVYSDTPICADDKDLDPETGEYIKDFDYETEKECCVPEFWCVVDVDTEVKVIYEKEMETQEGANFPKRAYEKFKEKYFTD